MGLNDKIVNTKDGKLYTISTIKKNVKGLPLPNLGIKIDVTLQTAVYEGKGVFGRKYLFNVNYFGKQLDIKDMHDRIKMLMVNAAPPLSEYVLDQLNDEAPASAFVEIVNPFHKGAPSIFVYRFDN